MIDDLHFCDRKRGRSTRRCGTLMEWQKGVWVCMRCERRRRGLCEHCDQPVQGRIGYAQWCPLHRTLHYRDYWRRRHVPKANPMPRAERSRLAGLKGGVTRRERLTADERRAIARLGGLARAAQFATARAVS